MSSFYLRQQRGDRASFMLAEAAAVAQFDLDDERSPDWLKMNPD
jgi:hypothetical protein